MWKIKLSLASMSNAKSLNSWKISCENAKYAQFYQGTQTYKKQKNFEKIKEHKEATINKNLRMTISNWLFNQESRKWKLNSHKVFQT